LASEYRAPPESLDLSRGRDGQQRILHKLLRDHFSVRVRIAMERRRRALQRSPRRIAPLPVVRKRSGGIDRPVGIDRRGASGHQLLAAADTDVITADRCHGSISRRGHGNCGGVWPRVRVLEMTWRHFIHNTFARIWKSSFAFSPHPP
jgi:hypothetical protein